MKRFLLFVSKHSLAAAAVIFLGLLVCSGVFYQFSSEIDSPLVVLLFTIPVFLQIFIPYFLPEASTLRGFYVSFMFVSISFYLLLCWPLYILLEFSIVDDRWIFSWLSIVIAIFLVIMVSFVTWIIMESRLDSSNPDHLDSKHRFINKIRDGCFSMGLPDEIRKHPFSTICFFFGIFLSITYLLSFAFAFHDKWVRKSYPAREALFAMEAPSYTKSTNLRKSYPAREALFYTKSTNSFNTKSTNSFISGQKVNSPSPHKLSSETWKILFKEGSAIVELNDEYGTNLKLVAHLPLSDERVRIVRNNKSIKEMALITASATLCPFSLADGLSRRTERRRRYLD